MGHTGCGGVKAAYTKESLGGMLDLWVTNIRNIMNDHKKQLSEQVTEEKKLAYLVRKMLGSKFIMFGKIVMFRKLYTMEHVY